MKSEKKDQHAGGRVSAMMSGPVIMDVFEECWVEDLNLTGVHRENTDMGLKFNPNLVIICLL